MDPIDLKARFGDRYRIGHDEAAEHETGGKQDPWFCLIPCRHGQIYPHSDGRLAVFCDRPRQFGKLAAIPGVEMSQEGDTEAVFVFPPEAFDRVAVVILPKRRRRLSETQRLAAIVRLRAHQYKPNSMQPSARTEGQNRVSHTGPAQGTRKSPIEAEGVCLPSFAKTFGGVGHATRAPVRGQPLRAVAGA